MVRITRKLSQELHQPRDIDASAMGLSRCRLAERLSCCDGAGYRADVNGAVLVAKLCDCVTSCPSCFGQARRMKNGVAVNCREPSPLRIANLLTTAMIPSRYGLARLDSFSNYTGNGREMLATLKSWVREFRPREKRGFILGGPVGVGKTYLLAAVAKQLCARGFSVRFVDFMQLLQELKAGYEANKADETLLKPLYEVDVLVIDELGKGRQTDWELFILDQLVMGRYNRNKTIIASTNYDLKPDTKRAFGHNRHLDQEDSGSRFHLNQFESLESRVGERIYSRFVEMCDLWNVTGHDYRKRFAQGVAMGRDAEKRPTL